MRRLRKAVVYSILAVMIFSLSGCDKAAPAVTDLTDLKEAATTEQKEEEKTDTLTLKMEDGRRTMYVGDVKAIVVSTSYTGEVTYQSTDENIATVDGEGVVTAAAPGEVEIEVKAGSITKWIHLEVKEATADPEEEATEETGENDTTNSETTTQGTGTESASGQTSTSNRTGSSGRGSTGTSSSSASSGVSGSGTTSGGNTTGTTGGNQNTGSGQNNQPAATTTETQQQPLYRDWDRIFSTANARIAEYYNLPCIADPNSPSWESFNDRDGYYGFYSGNETDDDVINSLVNIAISKIGDPANQGTFVGGYKLDYIEVVGDLATGNPNVRFIHWYFYG